MEGLKTLNSVTQAINLVDKVYYCSHFGSLRSLTNELLDYPRSVTKANGDRESNVQCMCPEVMEQSAACLTHVELYQELQKRA